LVLIPLSDLDNCYDEGEFHCQHFKTAHFLETKSSEIIWVCKILRTDGLYHKMAFALPAGLNIGACNPPLSATLLQVFPEVFY